MDVTKYLAWASYSALEIFMYILRLLNPVDPWLQHLTRTNIDSDEFRRNTLILFKARVMQSIGTCNC